MIKTPLMVHQKLVCDFAEDKEYAGIFAGYGTGKTLCALELIERNKWKTIVIVSTKTAITSTWPDEIEKHSSFRYCLLVGTEKQKQKIIHFALSRSQSAGKYISPSRATMIFLVNFDGVRNILETLAHLRPDAIFVDESTKIKSSRATRTKVVWALGRACKHRFAMTGFPITENLMEAYAQIRFLDNGATFGKSFLRFRTEYFYPAGFKWIPKKKASDKLFNKIKDFCIMVPETVIKLPPKVYNRKALDPSPQQKEILDKFKAYFQIELGRVHIDTDSIFTLLNKSLQICDGFVQDSWFQKIDDEAIYCKKCEKEFDKTISKKAVCPRCKYTGSFEFIDTPKDECLIDTLEELNGDKCIVWVNNRRTMSKVAKILSAPKLGHRVLTLSGISEDPGKVVKAFQFGKQYDILLATLKKASESITLTSCKNAYYYSQNWSYDLRGNSEARIRRKGSEKHKSITYTDSYIKGTTDQLVYECWRSKESVVKKLKKFFL